MKTIRIRQSDNKHQWFVEETVNNEYKIIRIFYSERSCYLYIKNKYSIQPIIDYLNNPII